MQANLPKSLQVIANEAKWNEAIHFICTLRLLCLTAFRTLREGTAYAMI
ncbi:MAG: hypothetical protein V7K88_17855 [Nostoc sp.]